MIYTILDYKNKIRQSDGSLLGISYDGKHEKWSVINTPQAEHRGYFDTQEEALQYAHSYQDIRTNSDGLTFEEFKKKKFTGKNSTGYKGIAYYTSSEMFKVMDGRSVQGEFQTLEDALDAAWKWCLL